jgi:hypothetical protein
MEKALRIWISIMVGAAGIAGLIVLVGAFYRIHEEVGTANTLAVATIVVVIVSALVQITRKR